MLLNARQHASAGLGFYDLVSNTRRLIGRRFVLCQVLAVQQLLQHLHHHTQIHQAIFCVASKVSSAGEITGQENTGSKHQAAGILGR